MLHNMAAFQGSIHLLYLGYLTNPTVQHFTIRQCTTLRPTCARACTSLLQNDTVGYLPIACGNHEMVQLLRSPSQESQSQWNSTYNFFFRGHWVNSSRIDGIYPCPYHVKSNTGTILPRGIRTRVGHTDPAIYTANININKYMGKAMKLWLSCYLFCYQLITKPGNKTGTVSWPDPYTHTYFYTVYMWYLGM